MPARMAASISAKPYTVGRRNSVSTRVHTTSSASDVKPETAKTHRISARGWGPGIQRCQAGRARQTRPSGAVVIRGPRRDHHPAGGQRAEADERVQARRDEERALNATARNQVQSRGQRADDGARGVHAVKQRHALAEPGAPDNRRLDHERERRAHQRGRHDQQREGDREPRQRHHQQASRGATDGGARRFAAERRGPSASRARWRRSAARRRRTR